MDPNIATVSSLGSVVNGLAPLLTVGGIAAVVTFSVAGIATTANVIAGTRRRALWRQVGADLGLRQETASGAAVALPATPILRGIRHGRAVEAVLLPNGQARISVRVANPRHLVDQISTADLAALTGAGWLTAAQCRAIHTLRDRRRTGCVSVRGSFVTLTAPWMRSQADGGEPLRALFQLVHTIAESVDTASGAVTSAAPAARGPRRFGPGTLNANRRA